MILNPPSHGIDMITYNPELFVRNVKGGHWPSQVPQLPVGEPAPTSRSKWVGEPD